ncbi:MAG TPA: hypothetical protein VKA45_01310, partial [Gaiellaceae bacterium]|nr:hypothetical protein [Gaiellaceae bacterium]
GFVVSGLAGTPAFGTVESELAPEVVIAGTDVLYTVSFPYLGKQTLVKGEIRITFPADWSFAPPNDPNTAPPASPNVCAPATSPDPATKLLSCIRGTIRPGDPIVQEVRFRTGAVADGKKVTSVLTFDEGGSDQDTGRSDIIPADPASVDVVLAGDDRRAGKCGDPDGDEVSTKQGISVDNQMTTKMILPANPDKAAICSPAFAREEPAGSIAGVCPTTVVCTTEIAITGAPQFLRTKPITLIFDIYGKPKDLYKTGLTGGPTLVPPCTRTNPPDPCVSKKSNITDGTRWTINWSGNDPSWTGG